MRLIYLGDVVGKAGREAVIARLPGLRRALRPDFVIVNGENAAHGFGITPTICDAIYAAGADVIVLGNHAWDNKEILPHIDREPRLLRPVNFPDGTPGRGAMAYPLAGGKQFIFIVQALGRVFMEPVLDDPFAAVKAQLDRVRLGREIAAIVIDIHAEASSEKMAMGHWCDGRASLVIGSHNHVPTADAQILPGGTAYQSDAGMCGDYNSVIGMNKAEPLQRFTKKIQGGRMEPAEGEATLCGVLVDTDPATGLARRIEPIRLGPRLAEAMPQA